jgi:hypothetical protein
MNDMFSTSGFWSRFLVSRYWGPNFARALARLASFGVCREV